MQLLVTRGGTSLAAIASLTLPLRYPYIKNFNIEPGSQSTWLKSPII